MRISINPMTITASFLFLTMIIVGCQRKEQAPTQAKSKEELKAEVMGELADSKEFGRVDPHLHRFQSNRTVRFDLDGDGKKESITFDTKKGLLTVAGFDPIAVDTMFSQTDYFIIVDFKDKHGNVLNMVGIVDYGPSSDVTTSLYSVIKPLGEKMLANVGVVPGEVVPAAEYNREDADHFNLKAVNQYGQGIEAPVRLSLLASTQTWYGRNLFTFYTTYQRLLDNANIYLQDYETNVTLQLLKPVMVWEEKDTRSKKITISSGQSVKLIETDNKEWVKLEAQDGSQGWLKDSAVNKRNFSGFPLFD